MLAEQGIENDVAVASVLGNTFWESRFKPNNLEDGAEPKSGYSDTTFTQAVDNGTISRDLFKSNQAWSPYPESYGGIYGYGLAQWTDKTRKGRLWDRTRGNNLSIADEDAQIDFLVDEIDKRSSVCIWRGYFDHWTSIYADDSNEELLKQKIRESADYYCDHFEVGGWAEDRYNQALQAYKDFHNAERPEGGGTWEPQRQTNHIIGYFISNVTHRKFAIYQQNGKANPPFWPGECNRAAAASIVSGYYSGSYESLPEYVNKNVSGYTADSEAFYNKFGLTIIQQQDWTPKVLDEDIIRNNVPNGAYIAFRLHYAQGGPIYSKTRANSWTKDGHWIAILGYKVENGKEYIFVSDSGSGGSGWWPIDEFSNGAYACRVTVVKEK